MFKGPIVTGPDCARPDCVGSDSVGPDCAGPDRTCTPDPSTYLGVSRPLWMEAVYPSVCQSVFFSTLNQPLCVRGVQFL